MLLLTLRFVHSVAYADFPSWQRRLVRMLLCKSMYPARSTCSALHLYGFAEVGFGYASIADMPALSWHCCGYDSLLFVGDEVAYVYSLRLCACEEERLLLLLLLQHSIMVTVLSTWRLTNHTLTHNVLETADYYESVYEVLGALSEFWKDSPSTHFRPISVLFLACDDFSWYLPISFDFSITYSNFREFFAFSPLFSSFTHFLSNFLVFTFYRALSAMFLFFEESLHRFSLHTTSSNIRNTPQPSLRQIHPTRLFRITLYTFVIFTDWNSSLFAVVR